jgi:hypothetical protein
MQQSSSNLFFEHLLPSFKVENVIWLSHDIVRATDGSAKKKVGRPRERHRERPASSCASKKSKLLTHQASPVLVKREPENR